MSVNKPTPFGKIVEFLYRTGFVAQSGNINNNSQLDNLVVELTHLIELDFDVDAFFEEDHNLIDHGFAPKVMMDSLMSELVLPCEVITVDQLNKRFFNFSLEELKEKRAYLNSDNHPSPL